MDYYKILGLEKGASDSEIKSSYRKLAKEHHPDRGGDAEIFKEISEAYSVLSDPQEKAKYDRFGSTSNNGHGGFNMEDIFSQFGDMFSPFGQAHSGGRRPKVGKHIQTTLQISIEDILMGVTKTVEYFRDEQCTPCEGKGGSGQQTCSNCNGAGHKTQRMQTPFGMAESIMECPVCNGEGQMILNPCKSCNGSGATNTKHKQDVKLPPGLLHGMRIEIPQGGDYIRNGAYGSLYVNIEEVAHPNYIRDGFDLIVKANISITTAVLGGDIVVDTPHGEMPIRVESGTQGGHQYEYSRKGMPQIGPDSRIYD